jgi:VWA domain-containing protein
VCHRRSKLPTAAEASLDVWLVLDQSGSVKRELPALVDAARAFATQLTDRDKSGIMTFRHGVTAVPDTAHGPERANLRLAGRGEGLTSLRDAIGLALAVRDPAFDRGLVVVLSDGVDTMSWLSETQVAASAARSDAVIYAVIPPVDGRAVAQPGGTGTYLADLVRQTSGRVIRLDPRRDVAAAFREVLDETRARYVLTYYPQGVASGPAGTIFVSG